MLDTNICIYLIKKFPPEIVSQFDNYRKGEIIISAITWAELCFGIKKDGRDTVEDLLSVLDVEPFEIKQATLYGELTSLFPNRKANLDRMIAAHAISFDVTLVTNNVDDFSLYTSAGLRIENWL